MATDTELAMDPGQGQGPTPDDGGALRTSLPRRLLDGWLAMFGAPFCAGMVALGGSLGLGLHGLSPNGWASLPVDIELADTEQPSRDADALALVNLLLAEHGHLGSQDRKRVARAVVEEASYADFDPLLVLAVMRVESEEDKAAVSNRGARGLMQLRQPTAQFLGEREQLGLSSRSNDLDDPALNVRLGVRYLSRLHRAFGNLGLALVAYNAGPHRVSEYVREGKELPDRLQSYPRKVNQAYNRLLRESGAESGALSGSDAFRIRIARR